VKASRPMPTSKQLPIKCAAKQLWFDNGCSDQEYE
jgi:hypothetical protein